MLTLLPPALLRCILSFVVWLEDAAVYACVSWAAASAVGHPGTWAARMVSRTYVCVCVCVCVCAYAYARKVHVHMRVHMRAQTHVHMHARMHTQRHLQFHNFSFFDILVVQLVLAMLFHHCLRKRFIWTYFINISVQGLGDKVCPSRSGLPSS